MLQEEGMRLEDAEQRVNQLSSDMQAIIGMQLYVTHMHCFSLPTHLCIDSQFLWQPSPALTSACTHMHMCMHADSLVHLSLVLVGKQAEGRTCVQVSVSML